MNKRIEEDIQIAASQYTREGNYWLGQLSGEPEKTVFPYDCMDGQLGQRRMETAAYSIPAGLYSRLMQLRNESDPRLHMVAVALVVLLLHKYSGSRDIMVGSPIYKQEMEGEFINTVLTLRHRVEAAMTFKDLLLQVRQLVVAADEHQNYPVETLLYKLGLTFADGDFPLFDVAVLLKSVHQKRDILHTKPNVIFSFDSIDGGIGLDIDYNALRYNRATVDRLNAHLTNLMQAALFLVDVPVARLEWLSPEEKRTLLFEFNGEKREFPAHTIHESFERQATCTPHRVAVVGPASSADPDRLELLHLTYTVLNERANRLAGFLGRLGAVPNGVVGIMVARTTAMVAGLLGILKTGAAYLAIDPGMPKYRVRAMLGDCGVSILLTQRQVVKHHAYTALQGLQEKEGELLYTGSRRQIEDLDSLPLPDRSLVNYEKYNRYIGQVMVKNIISLQTARGCPFNCSYCSRIWGRKHVFRSAESVYEELELYYNMGVRRFSIFDDIFNVNLENGKRLFQRIVKNRLDIQLFFPNGLRGDLLPRDYIDLLVEAGLAATALALETASPRLQRLINKNLDLEKFARTVEYFCQHYPHVILELFSIHGFPTETEEEARLTLDFIKSQRWLHFPYVFLLKVYPDTPMADLAVQHGVRREDILKCEDLAFHELSPTSPFTKSFTRNYQAEFLNEYFLSKERLMHVLPYQVKALTRDEMIQKYDSYLPHDIRSFADILRLAGIEEGELAVGGFLDEQAIAIPDFNRQLKEYFPAKKPAPDALRVLLLDLSQFFSPDTDMLYDVVEPPLGAMYVMTYLQERFGPKIDGKILKSRLDFDGFEALKGQLEAFRPQVIGVRSLTFYRDFMHQTVGLIRQWGFDVPIIAGGPYATRNSRTLLQDRHTDLAVLAEGEATFADIIGKIMANRGRLPAEAELRSIGGIAFRLGTNGDEPGLAREVVMWDSLEAALVKESGENPRTNAAAGDGAYIVYTSGSTGKPKGVFVEHRGAANVLHWFAGYYRLQPGTRVLQLTNYTFDPSVEQIFGSLLHGGTVVIPPGGVIADRQEFVRFVDTRQINMINFVPGILKDLLGEGEQLASLHTIISGGEKMDEPVKDLLLAKGYALYNQYGPSETTIDALASRCGEGRVVLGKPVANAACFVLDSDRNPVPIGVPGELYIGGEGVTRGYLNNPELTAERFVNLAARTREDTRSPNANIPLFHHSTIPGFKRSGRLYRTGDRARWLPGGNIEFLGRRDHQVKIRGYRIELGEIESQLSAYPGLKEAAVVLREDGEDGDNRYLCAYVVPKDSPAGNGFDVPDLRNHLSLRLPDYMMPACFVPLERIPRTLTGKLDRQALPTPPGDSQFEVRQAPAGEIEQTLIEVWAEVLGMETGKIGLDHNFFEIGGDSIKVIQVSARLKKHGLKLASGDIFSNPTVRELAACVKREKSEAFQGLVEGRVELTPIQRWFFEEYGGSRSHFNQAVMLLCRERFGEEVVEAIFRKIQQHHDALRMTFRPEGGEVVQMNHGPGCPFSLQVYDFSNDENARDAVENRANEIQAGIDLEAGPLLKLGLFHLKEADRLLIVVHHLVMDGISWRILFEDIDTLYRQYQRQEPLKLPARTDSFKTWAEKLKAYADSETCLAEQAYWQKLESMPVSPIDKDFEGENRLKDAALLSFSLDRQQTGQLLTGVNEAYGTEINDILLTGLGLGVASAFGGERVLLALEGHGREDLFKEVDISRTVGWFTTTYPLVLDISHRHDLSRQIKVIKEDLRRLPNRGIGYGILKYVTDPRNRPGLTFNLKPVIGFNYLGEFAADIEQSSFRVTEEARGQTQSPGTVREFQIDFTGLIANGRLTMSVVYSRNQFKKETVETLLAHYKTGLLRIIDHCLGQEEKAFTPSDFTYDKLSIDDVNAIEALFDR